MSGVGTGEGRRDVLRRNFKERLLGSKKEENVIK